MKKQKGTVRIGNLIFEVNILEVANKYGKIRYRVTPVAGRLAISKDVWLEKVTISK